MPYLDQSKLALPKSESDYNTWADYIELFTLLHPDRKLSLETLKDRLVDENDNDEKKALKQIHSVGGKVITAAIDKIADDQFDDDTDPEDDQRIKTALIGVIDYMKARKSIIAEYYPYIIDDKYSISKNNDLSIKHKVYIILLISSLIRIITRTDGYAYRITHRFEQICESPFRLLIPEIATVNFFGAGGYEAERAVPAVNTFYQKVVDLANELRLPLHPYFNPATAGLHNVGDGGLDWVSWLPFADNLFSLPTFFAQCACGNDWEDKLFDANKNKWNQFILFNYDYKIFHFIPKCYRDLNNQWLNNIKIHSAILIDRFRLIELLEKTEKEEEVVALYTDLLEELENTEVQFN